MLSYLTKRLIQSVSIILLISIIVFFSMRLMPGDPILLYVSEAAETQMSEERVELLRAEHGLDKPLPVQYINWLANIFKGDFGKSIFYRENITRLMFERFPITLYFGLLSVFLSTLLGISIGRVAAVRRGKCLDKVFIPFSYIGVAIPVFWLGVLLIYIFSLKLNWLPTTGFTWPWDDLLLSVKQTIMPVICLAFFGLASITRQMRSSMLDVLPQDYIRTAWAKGLNEKQIIRKHVMKNSLIPVITLLGVIIRMVIGGSVVVETVFAIPGVGRLLVSSVLAKDYLVVQAIIFMIAVMVSVINLLIDLSYAWLDPKVRYE
jgi:peptide/nickel transport system permease protein